MHKRAKLTRSQRLIKVLESLENPVVDPRDVSTIRWNLASTEDSKHFQYGTWDVEAANWWDLKLLGCWDGMNYRPFVTVREFLAYILQHKYDHYHWFAHFGGRYDINFIFDFLRQYPDKYKISFYCSGAMVLRLTIKYGGRTAHLMDSFRLLPAGLAKLTQSFNVEHQKMEFDFDTQEVVLNDELLKYNEVDCKGLYEVITKLFEKLEVQADTYASLGMTYWKKNYLRRDLPHPSDEIKQFVREGYHGGRVEVFKHDGKHINAFDVNSMYPFVMKQRIPVAYRGVAKDVEMDDKYYGFAHCTIDVPDCYMPVLPVRLSKLYFPTGVLTGIWSFEEIREACKRGAKILKTYRAYSFYTDYLFVDFVDNLYQWKVEGDATTRTIAKYLLNSLYGKFGQNPDKDIYCLSDDAPSGAEIVIDDNGDPTPFAKYTKRSYASHLLPHISASITSKARLYLLKSLNEQSYYCDTDSVFTTDTMPIYTKKLGAWEPQGTGHGIFYQPKLYFFEGKWKAKGVRQPMDKQGNVLDGGESVIKFVHGEPSVVMRHTSIKEALRKNIDAKSSVTISKVYREFQPKRCWDKHHQDTRPWRIDEIEK